jgi:REP element-mobilizing transposase RayT
MGYRIANQFDFHFVTFTVVKWVDVFTRKAYRDLFLENIKYCQREKGLSVHCWCIMSNHAHFIFSSTKDPLSNILRDLKKFSSVEIVKAIQNNNTESRKEWMLQVFNEQGQLNSRNKNFQFWQQHNCPKELFSPHFTAQKMLYIHDNPVRAGIVSQAEDYLYSSASNYYENKTSGLLDLVLI